MATIVEPTAAEVADRSWRVFPAGSNGEYGLPHDLAVVIDGGRGCRIRDLAGREYLDFTMGWGSVLLGHAHERVMEAVVRQIAHGSNFAHVTTRSLELAERLVALSPACDQVRFCASGTEATLQCVRLARGARRRGGILKFEGAYHGQHDLGTTSLFGKEMRP
ncbi:MAG: aminotransferase class III-fold pyridoxal phosphate-dependent enzyme, partial [Planctomycetota bacterium]